MIKILLTLIFFSLLFFGFSYLSKYDIPVEIIVSGYYIKTTGLFLIAQFLLNLSLFSFMIFLIKKIISSPYILYQKYRISKSKSEISNIITTAISVILDDKEQAIKLGKKFVDSENKEYKNFGTAVMTLSANMADQIHYLHELAAIDHSREYLINKKLMNAFLLEKNYHQAAFYANAAFAENEHDSEVYLALVKIYSKIHNPEKVIFFLEKAERLYPEIVREHWREIEVWVVESSEELMKSKDGEDAAQLLLNKLLIVQQDAYK
jgi:tetratricopeptide (TPR) repeat protein